MAKTRRAIQSSLKLVDIVAELIDARIPVSSRNPVLKSIIGNKPKIVLLNKSDMADPARTAEWVEYFKQHKTVAIPIDCKTGKGLNRLLPEIKNILREQIAAWERKGMVGRPIRIMVVGVPNVGKSSLINRLCKGGNAGKAAVQDKPGVTRRNQWFTIGKGLELLDTPGVLWPKFEDPVVGEHLAFTGAVRDEILGDRPVIPVLNKWDLVGDADSALHLTGAVRISALKNEGIPALLQAIEDNLPVKPVDVTALLPFAKTGIAAQLRKAGALVSEEYVPEGLLIHARVEPREMALIKPYIVENNSESENV